MSVSIHRPARTRASALGALRLTALAVGVLLDTMRQIESHLMMRHYDGFLKKGRIRGRF